MIARNRILAGASAVALAAGTTLAGAGIAGAQGSSEIAADLGLAATALDGPVTVTPNEEGGPTVTYTNETADPQNCLGFTLPYSTIEEAGIDPSGIDVATAGPVLNAIDAEEGVSLLTVATEGEGEDAVQVPSAEDSYVPGTRDDNGNGGILQMVAEWVAFGFPHAYPVAPDGTVEWVATAPETPAAGVILCTSEVGEGEEDPGLQTYFGIDPQVVADQINGRIPGGSLEIVSADDVSAGSVGMGATLLGSLGDDGADDDVENEDGGDAEEGTASGSASGSGSGGDDGEDGENGTLTAATLTN
ncbi:MULTISPECIES: hypothetical protein [Dietzia]|uniref:Uncharacterized protein n=1 Tax=Dietzia maris TaxID=37915 RepID=A0ABT8GZI6_9ACTN|nr:MULTISPECIES: hypothetical protein [Dietzia]MDJ0423675.1 hypothetical protein [Dietzia kunjamensis]MDN4505623.1 hypothetical protein [Dietzia maris]